MTGTPLVAEMTPKEIDTNLSDLHREEYELTRRILPGISISIGQEAKLRARLEAIRGPIEDYNAEYVRRGRWSRFFLVQHIHSSTNCSTCYHNTQYGWLPHLSGKAENVMVEEYGERACTVCFPSAPVNPAYIRSVEEREAAEAKAVAKRCPGSWSRNIGQPRGSAGVYVWFGQGCPDCGNRVRKTNEGQLYKHNR